MNRRILCANAFAIRQSSPAFRTEQDRSDNDTIIEPHLAPSNCRFCDTFQPRNIKYVCRENKVTGALLGAAEARII